jgi:hypothetical protein
MSESKPTGSSESEESKPYERKPFVFLHLPPDFCPKYSTLDEACSYARHGRWQGHQKIKQGRWKSFKDGRRRVIIFSSVIEDEEKLKANSEPVEEPAKKPVGRLKRPKPETSAAAAE